MKPSEITFRSYAQEECYNKALPYDKFLIAAKPRYGKTYTACKLLVDGWNVNFVVILSGMNVRTEWEDALKLAKYDVIVTTNKELNSVDLENLDTTKSYAFFVSTQKAGMNIAEERDPDAIPSQRMLIEAFNNFPGIKAVVFDECHFAEQTSRSKLLLDQYKYDKLIYLSGTPYTSSISNEFTQETTYYYTYSREQQDYRAGKLDYVPVKLNMYILDKYISLTDEEVNEGWAEAFKNRTATTTFLNRVIDFVENLNDKNNMIFVSTVVEANTVVKSINKLSKLRNVEAISAAGNCDRVDSTEATKFFEKNNETTKFIVTCSRLGTGCTIQPLQAVLFFCPTRSAIKFIQNSMRACSLWEGHIKDHADVICFNKHNGFGIYNTTASLEFKDKKTSYVTEKTFNEFTKDFPIFILDNVGLRAVDYVEATDFENSYVHGKTKLFTDMDSMEDFTSIFNMEENSLKNLVDAVIDSKATAEEKEAARERARAAFAAGGVEELNKELNKLADENGKKSINIAQKIIDKVEQMREAFQKAYIKIVERFLYGGEIQIVDGNVLVDYDSIAEAVVDSGFVSVVAFKNIIELHPDYVRCINKHVQLQMMNL